MLYIAIFHFYRKLCGLPSFLDYPLAQEETLRECKNQMWLCSKLQPADFYIVLHSALKNVY